MRKTGLVRRTPLARGTKPMKRGRVAPVNHKRKKKRFQMAFNSAEYVEWLTSHGCAIPGCYGGQVEAAHSKSRGAGGDWRTILPLCGGPKGHHREQHTLGIRTFEAKYGIDLSMIAKCYAAVWESRTGEQLPEPAAEAP